MTSTQPRRDDTTSRSSSSGRTAHSATGRKKSPLGWLPWAALALLALLIAAAVLLVRNVGDDGDDQGVDLTDDPAAADGSNDAAAGDDPSVGTAADAGAAAGGAPQAAPTTTSAAPDGGGAGGAASSLVAGDTPLLPVPADGLASLSGQAVTGTGVNVESVVADEGFWVGDDATNRVFVRLTPQARTTEGESPFQVQAGQRIDLTGTLVPLAEDPAAFGVEAADGAEQLVQQGHVVEATAVALT